MKAIIVAALLATPSVALIAIFDLSYWGWIIGWTTACLASIVNNALKAA